MDFLQTLKNIVGSQRLRYSLLAIFVALLPTLVAIVLVQLHFDSSPLSYFPTTDNEKFYWHQAKTFNAVQFDGGYYAWFEVPPEAEFNHYGQHGIIYPMVYGTLGHLLGPWTRVTPIVLNAVFVTAAILFFIIAIRPDFDTLKQFGWAMGFFWPASFYVGSAVYESFQQSIGVLLAVVVWFLHKKKSEIPVYARVLVFAFFIVMVLSRPSWVFLAFPVIYLLLPELPTGRRFAISIGLGLVTAFAAFRGWEYLAAPWGQDFGTFDLNPLGKLRQIATINILSYEGARYEGGNTVLLGLIIALILLVQVGLRTRRDWKSGISFGDWFDREFIPLFIVFNIVGITIALITFNLSVLYLSRATRYMGVHLLMTIMLLVAQRKTWPLKLVTVVFAASFFSMWYAFGNYYQRSYNQWDDIDLYNQMGRISDKYLIYTETENAWCNTLLIEEDYPPTMAIRGGIGIAAKFEDDDKEKYSLPFKSRFVIIDNVNRNLSEANFESVALTPYGELYINLDADCPPLPYQAQ